jgi:hypothetical protein
MYDNPEAVDLLLSVPGVDDSDGSDDYFPTPMHFACKRGNVEVMRILLRQDSSWFIAKSWAGDVSEHYVHESLRGSPLHVACRHGRLEIVKMMLQAGVDPTGGMFDELDDVHERPSSIEVACSVRRPEIVKELLSNRGMRERLRYVNRALRKVCEIGCVDTLDALLSAFAGDAARSLDFGIEDDLDPPVMHNPFNSDKSVFSCISQSLSRNSLTDSPYFTPQSFRLSTHSRKERLVNKRFFKFTQRTVDITVARNVLHVPLSPFKVILSNASFSKKILDGIVRIGQFVVSKRCIILDPRSKFEKLKICLNILSILLLQQRCLRIIFLFLFDLPFYTLMDN